MGTVRRGDRVSRRPRRRPHVCVCRRDRRFSRGASRRGGTLPGFGFVLHLLYLVGLGDRATRHGEGVAPCVERIAAPFRALGCPLRNAGALCAWLSRAAPLAADPPDLAELHEIMTGGSWVPQMVLSHPLLGAMDQAEEPGLEAAEFHDLVAPRCRRIGRGRDQALAEAWLCAGGKPRRLAGADSSAQPSGLAGRTGSKAPARRASGGSSPGWKACSPCRPAGSPGPSCKKEVMPTSRPRARRNRSCRSSSRSRARSFSGGLPNESYFTSIAKSRASRPPRRSSSCSIRACAPGATSA